MRSGAPGLLLCAAVLAGGCVGAYNTAQWRAGEAFGACLRACCEVAYPHGRIIETGGSYVSYSATKDGTLYYTNLPNPAAEARLTECLRTKYPELKVIQGSPPK